jgi:hypothetical protein
MMFLPQPRRRDAFKINRLITMFALVTAWASIALGPNLIPAADWRIPSGTAPANPGAQRSELKGVNIDEGYWQGAPVGGMGGATSSVGTSRAGRIYMKTYPRTSSPSLPGAERDVLACTLLKRLCRCGVVGNSRVRKSPRLVFPPLER